MSKSSHQPPNPPPPPSLRFAAPLEDHQKVPRCSLTPIWNYHEWDFNRDVRLPCFVIVFLGIVTCNTSNIFASSRLVWTHHVTEYPPAKTVTSFKTSLVAKKIWRIINTIASIWGENMLRYLSLDVICSSKRTVFLELRSRKTVSFEEQIMSADKYPSIFSRQMEAIVYISHD